ncbi:MAG: hypothetical protein IT513_11040 [Burkholderiales bacterium]|nr:hypothetical protein [Burkholderiales bacterium]
MNRGQPAAGPADPVEQVQKTYADWLEAGARLGLALLVVTFLAYVFDVWEPHVPIEHLPQLWSLPAHEFRAATGGPEGWDWLRLLGRGDYLTYVGVAVLSLASIVCFLRIAPALLARGERLYAAIALAQIAVLVLAASGAITGGH